MMIQNAPAARVVLRPVLRVAADAFVEGFVQRIHGGLVEA